MKKLLNGESCTYSLSLSTLPGQTHPGQTLLIEEQILPDGSEHYNPQTVDF